MQHGTDLVVFLSDILNKCSDKRGDTATSIALDTISVLCKNNVINIVSAWSTLSGKFKSEKRPKVVKSLCSLFGQATLLHNPTVEYQNLIVELTKKLWSYVVNSNDPSIIGFALKTLKNYNINDMDLANLPSVFRENLTLPPSMAKTPIDAAKDPVDVLTYIPGECWIQMLQKINQDALEDADDLIGHYISKEIADFRGGVYALPEGRPEPNDLKALPPRSVLRAISTYVIHESKKAKLQHEATVEHCLCILSRKYSKPIPPLNWCFLHDLFHRSFNMKKYSLYIAINQSIFSGTAKRFIENYLIEFIPNEVNSIFYNKTYIFI